MTDPTFFPVLFPVLGTDSLPTEPIEPVQTEPRMQPVQTELPVEPVEPARPEQPLEPVRPVQSGSGSTPFDKLRRELLVNEALRKEVEYAFFKLVATVNPSDRGQRFLYGNGAEWIMAAAAWQAGVLAAPMGHNADGFDLVDLLDNARGMWSVKASASNKASQIRLKNFMGSGHGATWDEPTLFISPYLGGAVLVDPHLHHEAAQATSSTKDALVVRSSAIRRFAEENPDNYIPFSVALNDGRKKPDPAAFAKTILLADGFPLLSAPFRAAHPVKGQRSISEDLEALKNLRDQGNLDDVQYQQAVNLALNSWGS